MSDQGEKTCPLCLEEMDLTDQQLKPCKCGYEICVWCWHQIMDLAEKEDTEGRCPACRTPYDKEKIVGMASNCERVVTEINSERRSKSHKAKPKTADGRKHLSSVRVIQRNLVYIIGIPSNLADEDLLQHKEYFGQYGKVQKVSIARTAGGAIQHSANNTCSVYITYSNEDEAVRCIQSVHGYTLEGKPLRACFGTTKYCHAWLRNMPCTNPDCLYLHDIGSGEDSFTKDEIISDYTRNRVQQNASVMNNLQRRSGSTLPPPADEFCISSSATSDKPIIKNVPNNSSVHAKGSPPNGSSGRSIALPAAASWGLRVSNSRPPVSTSVSLGGPTKQKSDSSSSSFSAVPTSAMQGPTLHVDIGKKSTESKQSVVPEHSREGLLEHSNEQIFSDYQATNSGSPTEVVRVSTPGPISSSNVSSFSPTTKVRDEGLTISLNFKHPVELDKPASDCASAASEKIHSLCTGLSSPGTDEHLTVRNFGTNSNGSVSTHHPSLRTTGSHDLQQYYPEHIRDSLTTIQPRNVGVESAGVSVLRESFDWRSELVKPVLATEYIGEEMDSLALDYRGLKLSENLVSDPSNYRDACRSVDPVSKSLNSEANESFSQFMFSDSVLPNGSVENNVTSSYVENGQYLGSYTNAKVEKTTVDMGESSIISNILSMEPDVWDDSLTSPHNLVKLLSDHDKHHNSVKLQGSLKAQNSNQSRFSFARQEDYVNQGSDMNDSFNNFDYMTSRYTHQDSLVNKDPYFEKLQSGFSPTMFAESDVYSNIPSVAPLSKLSASKSQIQPPPGFSFPNRAPPPGFSSQERMDQAFEHFQGNHLHDSYFSRNQYAGHTGAGYGSAADVELIDPAILAVGKGRLPNGINNSGFDMRSSFPSQFGSLEDPRLQMLMQQQMSGHQSMRFPDHIDRFSSLGDAYMVQSRYSEQPQASNPSSFGQYSLHQSRNTHMLNGHWDGWNELQTGNDLAMAELLRNERLGLNKHFTGYEDLKYRMPTSGDIYSRAYGI